MTIAGRLGTGLVGAGLLVAGLLATAWWLGGRAPPLHWAVGAEQGYAFQWRSLVERGTPQAFDVRGTLHLRVFTVAPERVRVGLQLDPVTVTRGRVLDPAWSALFAQRFYADLTPSGELLMLHAPGDVAAADAAVVAQALRALQIVVPARAGRTWTSSEHDHLGSFSAEYAYESATPGMSAPTPAGGEALTRHKVGYDDQALAVTRSSLSCRYGAPVSWLTACEGGELLVVSAPMGQPLKQGHEVSLRLAPRAAYDWSDADPAAEIAAWRSAAGAPLTIAEQRERDALLGGVGFGAADVTLPQFVAALFAACPGFHGACVNRLIDYLQLYPAAAAGLPALLLLADYTSGQRAMLVAALQSAQTPEAQLALMSIAQGAAYPADSRVQAIVALGDALRPAPGVVDALWALAAGAGAYPGEGAGSGVGAGSGASADARLAKKAADNALLSLGRLARTLGPDGQEIVARLHGELGATAEPGRLSSVMYAAANTGDASFVEPLGELLAAENPRSRAAAAQALGISSDAAVEGLLGPLLEQERDPGVRTTLMKSLHARSVSDTLVAQVCQALPQEDNDIVRGEMYRFLLKHRKRPGVRAALEAMLPRESAFENINLISRALAARK